MYIQTNCPHCDSLYEVPGNVLGKTTRCTKCGERFELIAYVPKPPPRHAGEPQVSADARDGEAAGAGFTPVPPPFPEASSALGDLNSLGNPSITPPKKRIDERLKFAPMLFLCLLLEGLAAIMAVGVVATVIVTVIGLKYLEDPDSEDVLRVLGLALVQLFAGLVIISLTLLFPQLMRLLLRIEQNTRASNESLREIVTEVPLFRDALHGSDHEPRGG